MGTSSEPFVLSIAHGVTNIFFLGVPRKNNINLIHILNMGTKIISLARINEGSREFRRLEVRFAFFGLPDSVLLEIMNVHFS